MSKIEWTEKTWNPLAGCDKISAGCKNCYAMHMAFRLMHMGQKKYAGVVEKTDGGKVNWTGQINFDYEALQIPLKNKKPTVYFVNSMSDLLHKDVPFDFIYKVFEMMHLAHWHTFQVLTKRADRLNEVNDVWFHLKRNYPSAEFPSKNVWLGVSVEDQRAANERIPKLLKTSAAVRFLSCEPLIGPVNLGELLETCPQSRRVDTNGHSWLFYGDDPYVKCHYCGEIRDALNGRTIGNSHTQRSGIHWVIVGGESGHGARPMHPDWVRSLRSQCKSAGVSFFFKQWGNWVEKDFNKPPYVDRMGFWCNGHWTDGENRNPDSYPGTVNMISIGKKEAGRLLDGRTWDEMPNQKDVTA